MRIAFVVNYCHRAGTFFRWHNLAIVLKEQGHDVHVFAGDVKRGLKSRKEQIDGISYHITPAFASSFLFPTPTDPFHAIWRFINLPRDFEVYHLFQPFLDGFIPWYIMRAIYPKKKYFLDWDDLWIDSLVKRGRGLKNKFVYNTVSRIEHYFTRYKFVTVCSTFLSDRVIMGGSIVYNGFSSVFQYSKEYSKKYIGVDSDNAILLLSYTGRTNGELNWLAHLCSELVKESIEFRLLLCGPSDEQIRSSGLCEYSRVVSFGSVDSLFALHVANASDFGLLPLEESFFNKSRFPIKFFDYLSCGTAVYYSPVGELSKIGFSIEGAHMGPTSKDKWVEDFIRLVKSNNYLLKPNPMSLYAQYSWKAQGDKLIKLYREVVS